MTPEADREAIYRRLYRAWPESRTLWGLLEEESSLEHGAVCNAIVELGERRRIEHTGFGRYRARMGTA